MTSDDSNQKRRDDSYETRLDIVKVSPSRPEPSLASGEAGPRAAMPITESPSERRHRSVQSVAETKVDAIVHEHDPRQQIHPLFFVAGLLFALIGMWLLFNDPALYGERRTVPGSSSLEDERARIASARVTRDAAQVARDDALVGRVPVRNRDAAPVVASVARARRDTACRQSVPAGFSR